MYADVYAEESSVTNDEIKALLDYHYWARDRMLAALDALTSEQFTQPIESSFKSIRDTAVHIMGAEAVWYSRWGAGTDCLSFAQVLTVILRSGFRRRISRNESAFIAASRLFHEDHRQRAATPRLCSNLGGRSFGQQRAPG